MLAKQPRLTVVLLTWNEERNIEACLDSLARQRERELEVVIIDAASTDGTVAKIQARMPDFPMPLRLEVAATRISVGEARNRGVALARAPLVAFLSADAEPSPEWAAEAIHSLRANDMVFGRQVHAPTTGGVGGAVRGLRYHHFPEGATSDPARYASNVSAAFRREVLRAFPFGTTPAASAVDDLLLTKRAMQAGYHAAYNPDMVVRHHDVADARAEMRKNLREGLGWGAFVQELGPHWPVVGWGLGLVFCAALFALAPARGTGLLGLALLYAPALRRAWRRREAMPAKQLLLGVLASPPFDLAFLVSYVRGLVAGGVGMPPRPPRRAPEELKA